MLYGYYQAWPLLRQLTEIIRNEPKAVAEIRPFIVASSARQIAETRHNGFPVAMSAYFHYLEIVWNEMGIQLIYALA